MILPFKEQFPSLILDGTKIHTIREDKTGRWQAGKKIHYATGVRTKNYQCFKEGICTGTQEINILYENKCSDYPAIYISGHKYTYTNKADMGTLNTLARNDGFPDFKAFCGWFNKNFKGKIIHWTTKRY
ncbi:MAG: hypothetical protein LUE98_11875 [Tannerellaceae bacterium]|nr:hypothetical protein [Tannerellaceae bacterium]